MSRRFAPVAAALLTSAALFGLRLVPSSARSPSDSWSATGTLLEACTCAVPCTCNFGEGPSPHPYCHAVFAYKLERGAWGETDLSGLVFGGADGSKGTLGFVDERATPAQRAALEQVARAVFAKGGPASGPRSFVPARITHSVKGNDLRLNFAGYGGFTARVIIGGDGKSPVVVENNTVWPIRRAIKGKALPLRFEDRRVGTILGDGSNANYGAFSFTGRKSATGRTSDLSAVASAPSRTAPMSCCAEKKN